MDEDPIEAGDFSPNYGQWDSDDLAINPVPYPLTKDEE